MPAIDINTPQQCAVTLDEAHQIVARVQNQDQLAFEGILKAWQFVAAAGGQVEVPAYVPSLLLQVVEYASERQLWTDKLLAVYDPTRQMWMLMGEETLNRRY